MSASAKPPTRLRVLHVYRTYFPDSQGGLEEVIRQICRNSQSEGIESRILTLSANPVPSVVETTEAMVYRERLTAEIASCGISIRSIGRYRRLLATTDVVNYHYPWPFADVLHFSSRSSRPSVVTYHSDIVRQRFFGALYTPLRDRFLASVDRIVCTSSNYLVSSPVLSRYADKVEVIPIGLDTATYPDAPTTEVDHCRRAYGRFFLFVGVLRQYKGLHILLNAVRGAPYKVLIAGAGPVERELNAQAARLGLDNVHFAGRVSDHQKVTLFKACHAVVLPSHLRSEAFGVTLLESAMFGKAMISTELGTGTSLVNADGETGLVVEAGSVSALRSALDRLWDRPQLAAEMGARARLRYEALFTGKLMGRRYAALYRQLMGASGSDTNLPISQAAT
jgi:O-antigen biosynthesis rhamnosyltransferase